MERDKVRRAFRQLTADLPVGERNARDPEGRTVLQREMFQRERVMRIREEARQRGEEVGTYLQNISNEFGTGENLTPIQDGGTLQDPLGSTAHSAVEAEGEAEGEGTANAADDGADRKEEEPDEEETRLSEAQSVNGDRSGEHSEGSPEGGSGVQRARVETDIEKAERLSEIDRRINENWERQLQEAADRDF